MLKFQSGLPPVNTMTFAESLIAWQKTHGRHNLPWQGTLDPYAIWVSEIMLQQTQVATVIPYYIRFMERFRGVVDLAEAPQEEVLSYWSGLGYYSRGRNLHKAARLIVERHRGIFPQQFDDIVALPGIGRSTAAAISAFAYGQRTAILDGNVKRVIARFFGISGFPGDKAVEAHLWRYAEQLLPEQGIEPYTQALMDLGATVCIRQRPKCTVCPVKPECYAAKNDCVAEYPMRRPKKVLPERETTMLIMRKDGQLLLERRPPQGIWGGLWAFPEIVDSHESLAYCKIHLGCEANALHALPSLTHTFTHFKLNIKPQLIEIERIIDQAAMGDRKWFDVLDVARLAIPTPVRRLVNLARDFELDYSS